MRKLLLALTILPTLFLGGLTPSPIQQRTFQRDLDALTKRGYTYRMLDNDLIELTDPVSGEKRLKSLREPSEATIRAWAASRGIPILEIDPNTIDTSKYTGRYKYWTTVPLSNTDSEPLLVGDADRNGKAEVYGLYWDNGGTPMNRIYQVDTAGEVSFLYDYTPRLGLAQKLIDTDHDSLTEFIISHGGSFFDYEQNSEQSLPVEFRFEHQGIRSYVDPGYTHIYLGNLDGDSLIDFLYKGSEIDSTDTTLAYGKVYVAEYDKQLANFIRVWSKQYIGGGEGGLMGFAVEDFDGDGKGEFVTVDLISGKIFVTENTGNNNYGLAWQDSVPFVNVSSLGSGDVDGDSIPELFTGATISDGDWTTVFEADSDNSFSPRLLIHLLSGGTFDVLQYMITDVDEDGKLELVICAGTDIYMFKSNHDDQYYLWYLKRETARDAIQFYDFNKDGRQDFVISKRVYVNPPGYFRNYADVYVGTTLVSVAGDKRSSIPEATMLSPSFPNPFNPSTNIQFSLPSRQHISLTIYDIDGRAVEELLNKTLEAGTHVIVWDGIGKSSGVYFCRLKSESTILARKLVLVR